MLSLPEVDTANFSALLPLSHQPLPNKSCPLELLRETRLALKILAAETEAVEDTDPILLRLEAKLDLVLEISLRERHPDPLLLTPCRIGLEAIVWRSTYPCQLGDTVLVSLNPNLDEALQLYLWGDITACQMTNENGYGVMLDIRQSFDKISQALWEKWVFRRHRLAVLER